MTWTITKSHEGIFVIIGKHGVILDPGNRDNLSFLVQFQFLFNDFPFLLFHGWPRDASILPKLFELVDMGLVGIVLAFYFLFDFGLAEVMVEGSTVLGAVIHF